MKSTAPLMAIATQLSSASVEKDMLLANLKVSGEKSKGAVYEMNASTSHLTLPIQAYLPKEAKARSIADFIAACSPRRYGETQRHSSFKEAVPDSLSHRRAAARPKVYRCTFCPRQFMLIVLAAQCEMCKEAVHDTGMLIGKTSAHW
eukprot:4642124-Pleurochrysis_carterae.AAC.2